MPNMTAVEIEDGVILIRTTCPLCQKPSSVAVTAEGFALWQAGAFVQHAFPEMPAAQREILISGAHPSCFAAAFPDED